eukprot:65996-Chlamydomonas_euryale.AAC.3
MAARGSGEQPGGAGRAAGSRGEAGAGAAGWLGAGGAGRGGDEAAAPRAACAVAGGVEHGADAARGARVPPARRARNPDSGAAWGGAAGRAAGIGRRQRRTAMAAGGRGSGGSASGCFGAAGLSAAAPDDEARWTLRSSGVEPCLFRTIGVAAARAHAVALRDTPDGLQPQKDWNT